MKLFSAIFVSVLLFLGGCTSKSGLFSPDVLAQRALVFTKKAEIYNSLEIKASMIATYLNPLIAKYQNKEKVYFLVSIFVDDDSVDPKKQGLYNPDIDLQLDGKEPLEVTALKEGDDLIKIAPIQNMWSHYYLISFIKPQKKEMQLLFKSQRYGSSVVTFVVDPEE